MNSAQNTLVRHALLVERIDGPLNELTPSLRAYGYQVMRASDARAIDGDPVASSLWVDATAAGRAFGEATAVVCGLAA